MTIELYHTSIENLTKDEAQNLIKLFNNAIYYRYCYATLKHIHEQGPVSDGYVLAKNDRTDLAKIGAVCKVIVKGDEGFNACTSYGHELLEMMDILYSENHGRYQNDTPPKEKSIDDIKSEIRMQVEKLIEDYNFNKTITTSIRKITKNDLKTLSFDVIEIMNKYGSFINSWSLEIKEISESLCLHIIDHSAGQHCITFQKVGIRRTK